MDSRAVQIESYSKCQINLPPRRDSLDYDVAIFTKVMRKKYTHAASLR
jgi:hypothetical protein